MIIAGLDLSSHSGIVIKNGTETLLAEEVHFECNKTVHKYARYFKYVDSLVSKVRQHNVDVAIVEGYSHAGKFVNYFQYEIGALVKGVLFKNNIPFIEVPPKSLKKYVTGKGNGKKSLMLLEVYKRWNFTTDNDNIADAYGLAEFGTGLFTKNLASLGLPKTHTVALDAVHASHKQLIQKLRLEID